DVAEGSAVIALDEPEVELHVPLGLDLELHVDPARLVAHAPDLARAVRAAPEAHGREQGDGPVPPEAVLVEAVRIDAGVAREVEPDEVPRGVVRGAREPIPAHA